jgi:hypothetical protein
MLINLRKFTVLQIFQNKTQLFIGYGKFHRQRRKHETEIADDETCYSQWTAEFYFEKCFQ